MAIDRVVRTVVSQGRALAGGQETVRMDDHRAMRPAVALVRSLAMVVLAALAILVLLPAAIAAQAASGI